MEWIEIEGYEGLYSVNKLGQIRNDKTGTILKGSDVGHGYIGVSLTCEKETKRLYVHRIVACAFIDNASKRPVVNHLNGNKRDNRVENLEWCTQKQNVRKFFKSNITNNSTLTASQVREIEEVLIKVNVSKIAREMGINRLPTIYEAMYGKSRKIDLLHRLVARAKEQIK